MRKKEKCPTEGHLQEQTMSSLMGEYAIYSLSNKYPTLDFILVFLKMPSYIREIKYNCRVKLKFNALIHIGVVYMLDSLLRFILALFFFNMAVCPLFNVFYDASTLPQFIKPFLLFVCYLNIDRLIQKIT